MWSIDRDTASRLGLTAQAVDSALYDAFGQRQVSTMYKSINQYHVVLALQQQWWESPDFLDKIYVQTPRGLSSSAVRRSRTSPQGITPLSLPHQGQFPATTISFNLPDGVSLSDAVDAINKAELEMGMPASITGKFAGTAQAFQDSLSSQPILIVTALLAVYIVLGILYESLIHPLTIISTLPSAGVGALIALVLFRTELTIIAMIGIILLIGIVKKNAIMMIDFALAAERNEGLNPRDAIFQACLLRFRPIMMTTTCALLGGMPLALGSGVWFRTAPPAGYRDRGRSDREPDADAVHDAGDLFVSGSSAPALQGAQAGVPPSSWHPHSGRRRRRLMSRFWSVAVVAFLFCSACTVGPKYQRPSAPVAPALKELTGNDQWKMATPSDELLKGKWWEIFGDPDLNRLEELIAINNQNVKQAEAQFRQARTLIDLNHANYYPIIGSAPSISGDGLWQERGPFGGHIAKLFSVSNGELGAGFMGTRSSGRASGDRGCSSERGGPAKYPSEHAGLAGDRLFHPGRQRHAESYAAKHDRSVPPKSAADDQPVQWRRGVQERRNTGADTACRCAGAKHRSSNSRGPPMSTPLRC